MWNRGKPRSTTTLSQIGQNWPSMYGNIVLLDIYVDLFSYTFLDSTVMVGGLVGGKWFTDVVISGLNHRTWKYKG